MLHKYTLTLAGEHKYIWTQENFKHFSNFDIDIDMYLNISNWKENIQIQAYMENYEPIKSNYNEIKQIKKLNTSCKFDVCTVLF